MARYLILYIIILNSFLFSKEITISHLDNDNNLLLKSDFYIDKTSKKDFDFILKNPKVFKKYNSVDIDRGFTYDIYWFKFSIKNDFSYRVQRTINITNPGINGVELYFKEKGIFKKEIEGVKTSKKEFGNILSPYFDIVFNGEEVKEFYLKIYSKTTSVDTKVVVLKKEKLYQNEIIHQMVLVMFFTAILTLIIYNSAIYIFSKDKAYIFYISYFLILLVYYMYYTNMGRYFTDIEVNFIGAYLLSAMLISLILFTRTFLETKRFKKIDFTFDVVIIVLILLCVISSEKFYPIDILVAIFLVSLFFILFVAYYALFKKVKQAKYFVVGWSIAVIGYIYFALLNYNLISDNYKVPYFYELSIFLEAIIFSTALVNKLNTTKMLESQVKKNEILIKEIHHRVKNNMQFIISLYRLKLNQNIDERLARSLDDIENIIQGMGKTHELLYKNTNLEFIDANEYFSSLIEELKRSFDLKDINIDLKTDVSLEMEQSIICGIILNELLTNSLKYAFEKNRGKIDISLFKEKNRFKFIIKDDGIGFDSSKISGGFGHSLIKGLTTSNLGGKFEIDSSSGTKVFIEF